MRVREAEKTASVESPRPFLRWQMTGRERDPAVAAMWPDLQRHSETVALVVLAVFVVCAAAVGLQGSEEE